MAGVLVIITALALLISWDVYRYHECKHVGHSALYCVLDIGH